MNAASESKHSPATAAAGGGAAFDLPDLARAHGLVVIAGAGISMLAPTSLPGWRDFNRTTLEALAERVGRETNPQFVGQRLETLLARRDVERVYAPDFMAQLMEEEAGEAYFRVLQALDAETCNRNHRAIAALARAGSIKAIVTTNFDRLLERSLDELGVAHRVFATAADFDGLGAALADPTAPLPLIKAHGTVERPDTMVDTLAQRVRGRPEALNAAVRLLLERHAALSLGFSGADLDYDPDYLGLRDAAATARAFVALSRAGAAPRPALLDLIAAFGDRGRSIEGQLPDALDRLASALGVDVPTDHAAPEVDWKQRLARQTAAWVDGLGTMQALNMFIALVDAAGDDPWMLDFLLYFRRYYRTEEHTVDPWKGTAAYWRYEYQFGRRLLERGRLTPEQHERDNGQRLLSSQVISFRQYEDALNLLGNVAKRGDLLEAHVAVAELCFWVYGPGRAVAAATRAWGRIAETPEFRHGVDAMITISRVYEWSGEYAAALGASQAGVLDARSHGDEPRRAAALLQYARTLALTGRKDDAEGHLAEGARVAERLSLGRLQVEAQAARGMLDVLSGHDRDAIEPLSLACAFFRRSQRLPRLFITLLDLVRAAYYAGDEELIRSAQLELHALGDLFPGVEGFIALLKLELARDQKDWPVVAKLVDALEHCANRDAEYPWRWGLGRVEKNRAVLAGKA